MLEALSIMMLIASGVVMVRCDVTPSSVIPVGFAMTNNGNVSLYSPQQDFKLVFRDGAIKLLAWSQDETHPSGAFETVLWAICPTDGYVGETFSLTQMGNLQLRSPDSVLLWSNPINPQSTSYTYKGPFLLTLDDSAQLNEYSYANKSLNGELIWSTADTANQNMGVTKGACFQYGDCNSTATPDPSSS